MCFYLFAVKCLCGGFHGSIPPQNQVGSSILQSFEILANLSPDTTLLVSETKLETNQDTVQCGGEFVNFLSL